VPLNNHTINQHLRIDLWKIDEPVSFFTGHEALKDFHFQNDMKHLESRRLWMASRVLLFESLGSENYRQLYKDENGKPLLRSSNLHLSLSHSGDMVALIVSNLKVGIDIQEFSVKMNKIDHKFIPEKDLEEIEHSNAFPLEKKHVHWGIKESLFKAYGLGGLDFKENLILNWKSEYKSNGDSFTACIKKLNFVENYQACYQEMDNYMLCYVYES
jgi:4'-phosphopantetheinyl transferase